MEQRDIAALLVSGSTNVAYLLGPQGPSEDVGRSTLFRPTALFISGQQHPHLFTPYPWSAPNWLPHAFVHAPVFLDRDDGLLPLRDVMNEELTVASTIAVDELTHPLRRMLTHHRIVEARSILSDVKVRKTVDEIACIALAQRLTEQAMDEAFAELHEGTRQIDLTAAFAGAVTEAGGASLALDTIWQVMAPTRAQGPWTTHGDLAYPTVSTDLVLQRGDVLWVDAGITYEGYASDYGRTWLVDTSPTPRQQLQFERWCEVVDAATSLCRPGTPTLELNRAARQASGGDRPWIEHFYLAHGVGTDSAELPFIGTDLGEDFDAAQILAPGMVLVFEPIIWDEGCAGFRAEDVIVITDDGWQPLSNNSYAPFGDRP